MHSNLLEKYKNSVFPILKLGKVFGNFDFGKVFGNRNTRTRCKIYSKLT